MDLMKKFIQFLICPRKQNVTPLSFITYHLSINYFRIKLQLSLFMMMHANRNNSRCINTNETRQSTCFDGFFSQYFEIEAKKKFTYTGHECYFVVGFKMFLLLQNFPQLKMNARYMRVTQTIIKYYRTTKKAEKKESSEVGVSSSPIHLNIVPPLFDSIFFAVRLIA